MMTIAAKPTTIRACFRSRRRELRATHDWFRPHAPISRNLRLFRRSVLPESLDDQLRPDQDRQEVRCPGTVLTVSEACQRLRVSRWTLYRLIHERKIKTFKLGSRRLIPESAIWTLIDQLSDEETV